MLKISYVGCLDLYLAISAQFILEMCVAARNCKKFTKFLILGVQGYLKSSTLTFLKTFVVSAYKHRVCA